jgi:hypothetical protein
MRFKIVLKTPDRSAWREKFAWWPVKVHYGYEKTGRPTCCWAWLETVNCRQGSNPRKPQYLLVGESIWLWDVQDA